MIGSYVYIDPAGANLSLFRVATEWLPAGTIKSAAKGEVNIELFPNGVGHFGRTEIQVMMKDLLEAGR